MKQYLDLLKDIVENGEDVSDRTGVGTRCVFGRQLRFDLSKEFPAVTTKKLAFNSMKAELLWFISGSSNVNDLRALQYGEENRFNTEKVTVWDANYENQGKALGYENGELGPIYGVQWRDWLKAYNIDLVSSGVQTETVDQLGTAIDTIKNNPDSRRIIVSAWNPSEIPDMTLPPCHVLFQFRVINNKLSCQIYQRSCDTPLGLPFNIASYALLTCMVAQICGLGLGELVWVGGDVHIYSNQLDTVKEQLSREPLTLPKLWLNPEVKEINDFTMDDIKLVDYEHHAQLKYEFTV